MSTSTAPATPAVIRRADYAPPAFLIDSVALEFDLVPERTVVKSTLRVRRNPDAGAAQNLVLIGEQLEFVRASVDGRPHADVRVTDNELSLGTIPDSFELTIENVCNPAANTTLSGLYVSSGNFFTQCEAEGFRRITYFLDRPDVMADYTVTLRADKAAYPVLLSNGNLVEEGDLPDGRHFANWDDPFPKPSYLFALVAGKLVAREQRITTRARARNSCCRSGSSRSDLDKTEHAMDSLITSIRWDEERFGLELDLDRFMIVAVSDFNMGAMENKGLNIFNTKYVLANPDTATDTDFANIESVVGHEYFHNWTGNRVTCRDWFQLSLKEGLTVFRDQEFSADMAAGDSPVRSEPRARRGASRTCACCARCSSPRTPARWRIRCARTATSRSTTSTPMTVYEKGAEVVRMMQTLVGRDGFARGMDAVLQAPRRPGRDLRRLRVTRSPTPTGATCCRSSSAGTARRARRASA